MPGWSDAMSDIRTIRAAREAIVAAERELERIEMSPAAILAGFGPEWYLHKARTALRQAERSLAKADDPRLPQMKAMNPQASERRPSLRPRRKRHRCPACFHERLLEPGEARVCGLCRRQRGVTIDMEPVARRSPTKTPES